MGISLYRRITIERLYNIMLRHNLLDGGGIPYENSFIQMWTNSTKVIGKENDAEIKEFIEEFHKQTHDVSAEEPIELLNGGSFLGAVRSEYISDGDYKLYFENDLGIRRTVTGLVNLAYKTPTNKIFYVPAVMLYHNDSPRLFVHAKAFTLAKPISVEHSAYLPEGNKTTEGILIVDIKEDPLNKIYDFAIANMSDDDYTLANVYFTLDQGEYYLKKDRLESLKNDLVKLSFTNNNLTLLNEFFYLPLVKIENNSITEVVIHYGSVIKTVPLNEFLSKRLTAVILAAERTGTIRDLDPEIYDFTGRSFYVDDTDWIENENGGYVTKIRVVAEKEQFAGTITKGIVKKSIPKVPSKENAIPDSVTSAMKYFDKKIEDLKSFITKYKDEKRTYEISSKEVLDISEQMIKRNMNETEARSSVYVDGGTPVSYMSGKIYSLIATIKKLPDKIQAKETLKKIEEFFKTKLKEVNDKKNEMLKMGNVKEAKEVSNTANTYKFLLNKLSKDSEKKEVKND